MRRFSALYEAIDRTTSTNAKVAALAAYFRDAPPADAAWATFFLTGRRLKRRIITSAGLREWAQELTQTPDWLLAECYSAAGDFGELVALALDAVPPGPPEPDLSLASWVEERLLPLQKTDPAGQRAMVTTWWLGLPRAERFLLNKLLTGEFRVGVAHTLVVRALAIAAGIEPTRVAARLMGDWKPSAEWFTAVVAAEAGVADPSQPYPFFLAAPLEGTPATLGDRRDWLVEWKWDGIRAQLVRRNGETWLWSRGEELDHAPVPGNRRRKIEELDKWIRRHTLERHGPVRAVDPVQVFELGFEAIAVSSRHKSGIAVRFPRMLRWRKDKPPAEADSLDSLRKLLNPVEPAPPEP